MKVLALLQSDGSLAALPQTKEDGREEKREREKGQNTLQSDSFHAVVFRQPNERDHYVITYV